MADRYVNQFDGSGRSRDLSWMILALLLISTAAGTALFAMRQQRLELAYEIAQLHSQMDRYRANLWDMQVRIADLAQPAKLEEAILHARLHMEPAAASAVALPQRVAVAQSHHGEARHDRY